MVWNKVLACKIYEVCRTWSVQGIVATLYGHRQAKASAHQETAAWSWWEDTQPTKLGSRTAIIGFRSVATTPNMFICIYYRSLFEVLIQLTQQCKRLMWWYFLSTSTGQPEKQWWQSGQAKLEQQIKTLWYAVILSLIGQHLISKSGQLRLMTKMLILIRMTSCSDFWSIGIWWVQHGRSSLRKGISPSCRWGSCLQTLTVACTWCMSHGHEMAISLHLLEALFTQLRSLGRLAFASGMHLNILCVWRALHWRHKSARQRSQAELKCGFITHIESGCILTPSKEFSLHSTLCYQLMKHYESQWKNREVYWCARQRSQTVGDLLTLIVDSYDKSKLCLPVFPLKRSPKRAVYEMCKRTLLVMDRFYVTCFILRALNHWTFIGL